MALLRLRAPSGMNGGLSYRQEEMFKVSPFTSGHAAQRVHQGLLGAARLYLLVPLGGHGQVEPVQDVVHLLALHFGLDASRQEAVAGLERAVPSISKLGRNELTERASNRATAALRASARRLTSFFTCMTPSSVSVLVSITLIPSADSCAKTFCGSEATEHRVTVRQTLPSFALVHSGVAISHLILLRQLVDLLHVTFVGYDDQRLRERKDQRDFNVSYADVNILFWSSFSPLVCSTQISKFLSA